MSDDSASRKAFEEWHYAECSAGRAPTTRAAWQASRTAALAERDKVLEEAEKALSAADDTLEDLLVPAGEANRFEREIPPTLLLVRAALAAIRAIPK